MTRVELKELTKRAVAGVVVEAATEWRLLTYGEVRQAVLDRTGIPLKGTFDEKHRLGDVTGYLLTQGLPMATAIVVNENKGMLPGRQLVEWIVRERTGHSLDEVSEAEKRQAIADEQLDTFRRADAIVEAVRRWTIL